ncbi:response regulator [Thauera mechernichensis]
MNMPEQAIKPLLLIVNDVPTNIEVLRGVLRPHYRLKIATCGERALQIAAQEPMPDLVLLDVMMPDMDGYAVCKRLKADPRTHAIPVIFVSACDDEDDHEHGFDAGAVDYITKPVRPRIVLSRVAAHLAANRHTLQLEAQVRERTRQLNHASIKIIRNLCNAAEFKDDETGKHVVRMSHYARSLARALQQDAAWSELLFNAAPMHDIGKIGIPDHILGKPGKLTAEEWEVMKTHAAIGAHIIGDPEGSELLALATTVAVSHHEKWDGSGYPRGLAGEAIPLAGRIVAVADVFDALTSVRPYKKAWSVDDALAHIQAQAGQHFDPVLAASFVSLRAEIEDIRARYAD